MVDILNVKYSNPIEREYEGWITHQIEKYFDSINRPCAIWAVSPQDEPTWPADEHLVVGTKLIGLQFKKTDLAITPTKKIGFDRLKWSFHQPPGQFPLIQKRPEIFYCLPTFINRDWRNEALHHCLFWRPGKNSDRNAWYNNPNARTINNRLENEPRWGLFLERIFSCDIGVKIKSINEAEKYIKSLIDDLVKMPQQDSEDSQLKHEPKPLETFLISIRV